MGRNDEDDLTAAQILYPCMQCADIFFLKVFCQSSLSEIVSLRFSDFVWRLIFHSRISSLVCGLYFVPSECFAEHAFIQARLGLLQCYRGEDFCECTQQKHMSTALENLMHSNLFFVDLQADICQLGMDQRKVNVLAREYCDLTKRKLKPIILSHRIFYDDYVFVRFLIP